MSGELAFPWEREAMRGEEMPEGLSFPDQMAYTTLRNVYQAYYNKIISRDVAAAEKGRLKYQYERAVRQMNFYRKLCDHHVRVIKATEVAKSTFRKAPSIEAGLRLCQVLDGIQLPPLEDL